MATPAIIYVNPEHDAMDIRGQAEACLRIADLLMLDLRYWAHDPLDAPPLVATGRAVGLVVAAPDVLGPPLIRDAVTAQIELAGGRLYVPTSRHHVYEPEMGVQMASRLHRRGWSDEQIADVLETTLDGVQALLRNAGRRGLLGPGHMVSSWLHRDPSTG